MVLFGQIMEWISADSYEAPGIISEQEKSSNEVRPSQAVLSEILSGSMRNELSAKNFSNSSMRFD